jgi:hypothetical protein
MRFFNLGIFYNKRGSGMAFREWIRLQGTLFLPQNKFLNPQQEGTNLNARGFL